LEVVKQYRFAIGGLLVGAALTLVISQYPGIIEFHFSGDSGYVRVDGHR
jgi:hypothetical protein